MRGHNSINQFWQSSSKQRLTVFYQASQLPVIATEESTQEVVNLPFQPKNSQQNLIGMWYLEHVVPRTCGTAMQCEECGNKVILIKISIFWRIVNTVYCLFVTTCLEWKIDNLHSELIH